MRVTNAMWGNRSLVPGERRGLDRVYKYIRSKNFMVLLMMSAIAILATCILSSVFLYKEFEVMVVGLILAAVIFATSSVFANRATKYKDEETERLLKLIVSIYGRHVLELSPAMAVHEIENRLRLVLDKAVRAHNRGDLEQRQRYLFTFRKQHETASGLFFRLPSMNEMLGQYACLQHDPARIPRSVAGEPTVRVVEPAVYC